MRTVTTAPAAGSRARRHQQLLQGCFTTVLVGVVLFAATLAGAPRPAPAPAADPPPVASPVWEESWSQRYPGCVAMVLWPEGEHPVALVTQSPDGAVTRVPVASEQRIPLGDRAVGACR